MSSFPFFSQFSEESVDEQFVIDCANDGIKSFKEISVRKNAYGIKVLKLGNNSIKEFDTDFFDKYNTISYMDVSENLLENITGIDFLQNLIILDISKNQIKSLKGIDNNKKLRRILASRNQIEKFDIGKPMPNVVLLDLHRNQIPDLMFYDIFPSLKELHIGNNKIDSLEQIPLFQSLRKLSVQNNKLTNIKPLIHNTLTELDVSGTGITNITYFQMCPALTRIDISRNPITEESLRSGKPFEKIKVIKADFTELSNADVFLEIFPNATTVSIAGCQFTNIGDFENLLRNSKTLQSFDTRWNPVCNKFYVHETEESIKMEWNSINEYNAVNVKYSHRRLRYRKSILQIKGDFLFLDGIKVQEVDENQETDSDYTIYEYEEEEEEDYDEVLDRAPIIIEQPKAIVSEYSLVDSVSDDEADDEDYNSDDNDDITPYSIKTSSIGIQASDFTPSITISSSISVQRQSEEIQPNPVEEKKVPEIDFAAVDNKKKEEMIQKLKIENSHLEDQLIELKKFNIELEGKLQQKSTSFEEVEEELKELKRNAEMKEKTTVTELETSNFDCQKEPRNDEILLKILNLLIQHNNFLVEQLKKIKYNSKKKYPSFKDVIGIVDFLIGGNKNVLRGLKEEEKRTKDKEEKETDSDELERIKYLAEQIKKQNKLIEAELERTKNLKKDRKAQNSRTYSTSKYYEPTESRSIEKSRSKKHHSESRPDKSIRSTKDYSRSKYDDSSRDYIYSKHYETSKDTDFYDQRHRKRNAKRESTNDVEYIERKKNTSNRPDNCQRMILGYARRPTSSMFSTALDPNGKESRLLLFWSQYAISSDIDQIYSIKSANTERFIEAEYKFGSLQLFLVPCEDPVLFFDSFFPRSVVAFRKFKSKPKIRSFLLIAYNQGKSVSVKEQPDKSGEKKYRKDGIHSVIIDNNGNEKILILDTSRIIPIYTITVA